MAIRITGAGVALTVGIIVVTGLIIGGFFLAKNSGEQARQAEAVKIAEQNLEEQSSDDVALNESDKASNEANKDQNDASKEDVTKNEAENENSDSSNSTNDSSSNQSSSELPQTGPADQLAGILGLSLLTFSVFSYVNSRQQARS